MKKKIERICKNCESWIDIGYRFFPSTNLQFFPCNSRKIWNFKPEAENAEFDDAILPALFPNAMAFCPGPNFGCIHFKARP